MRTLKYTTIKHENEDNVNYPIRFMAFEESLMERLSLLDKFHTIERPNIVFFKTVYLRTERERKYHPILWGAYVVTLGFHV